MTSNLPRPKASVRVLSIGVHVQKHPQIMEQLVVQNRHVPFASFRLRRACHAALAGVCFVELHFYVPGAKIGVADVQRSDFAEPQSGERCDLHQQVIGGLGPKPKRFLELPRRTETGVVHIAVANSLSACTTSSGSIDQVKNKLIEKCRRLVTTHRPLAPNSGAEIGDECKRS